MTKKIMFIIAVLFALMGSPVSASYYGDYYGSYPSYSSNFNIYDSASKSTNEGFDFNLDRSNFNNVQNSDNSNFFADGFFNNNYAEFNQAGLINLDQTGSFKKKPCVSRVITAVGGFKDYKIKEKICDGVKGTFSYGNAYQNAIDNNQGYNQINLGLNVQRGSQTNSLSQSNNNIRSSFNKYYQFGQQTSLGKGTQIIFY
ncbi:MAG: hypothetical protein Q8Q42_03445 [Nanoarchaeota archaeon]|nr:hypothetical protein [Nanoarchaeota archaeon]